MVRGITVCVQYDDLLSITLPANLRHLDEVVIVTSSQDRRTQDLAEKYPRVRLHVTDSFYRHEAIFNKGLAMEEGFDVLGRSGWLMVFDADTMLPPEINWNFLTVGFMYTPRRYMLADPSKWSEALNWKWLPIKEENEWAGYCQVFSADDPRLKDRRPWYGVNWPHAGGCDSDFQQIWPGELKLRPNFEVLHLGEDCKNWCGRVTKHLEGVELPDQPQRYSMMTRVQNDWSFRLQKLNIKPIG